MDAKNELSDRISSVRIVSADSYLRAPLLGLDPCYSEFRGNDIKQVRPLFHRNENVYLFAREIDYFFVFVFVLVLVLVCVGVCRCRIHYIVTVCLVVDFVGASHSYFRYRFGGN